MTEGTIVQQCASLSSLILTQERLYQVHPQGKETPDYLQAGQARCSLLPGPKLADLEDFMRRAQREEIFLYKKNFIAEALQQEIRARTDVRDAQNLAQTVRFVLFEVMPYMIDTAHELGELLGVPLRAKSGEEVIQELVASELEKVAPKETAEKPQNQAEIFRQQLRERLGPLAVHTLLGELVTDYTSLLGALLPSPVYLADGSPFLLKEAKGNEEMQFRLRGKTYTLGKSISVQSLEQKYNLLLHEVWKREAVEEIAVQEEQLKIPNKDAILLFAAKKEFAYGNLGFLVDNQKVWVYWETPKFAMQNPITPKEYHPFPPTKICVAVNYSNGALHQGEAHVKGPFVHPFLHNWAKEGFEKICILNNTPFTNDAYGVVRRISTAVNAYMNGLTEESVHAHGGFTEDVYYFHHYLRDSLNHAGRLTREEAEKQGCKITNEWNLKYLQKMNLRKNRNWTKNRGRKIKTLRRQEQHD